MKWPANSRNNEKNIENSALANSEESKKLSPDFIHCNGKIFESWKISSLSYQIKKTCLNNFLSLIS